jgi:hypothetical protein
LVGFWPGNSHPCGRARRYSVAQKFEQRREKYRIAILATLAVFDAQHHALGIDIGDLQKANLGDAQPRAIAELNAALYFDAPVVLRLSLNGFYLVQLSHIQDFLNRIRT